MIIGAAKELKLGDPRELSTHVGPVIDTEAKGKLDEWIGAMQALGFVRFRSDADRLAPKGGTYVQPTIIELADARELSAGGVWSGAACGALACQRARTLARGHRGERLCADAWRRLPRRHGQT